MSIPNNQKKLGSRSAPRLTVHPRPQRAQADEPVFGSRARLGVVRTWNSSVDRVFGDLVRFLSDRNL